MYVPLYQNEPGRNNPNGAAPGDALFTTSTEPQTLYGEDALMQARRVIAQTPPDSELCAGANACSELAGAEHVPEFRAVTFDLREAHEAGTNETDALHSVPAFDHTPASQAARELLGTLQSATLQKQSVDGMIALLTQETQAARQRRNALWARNLLVMTACMFLLTLTHGRFLGPFWLLFNLSGGWWAMEQATKRLPTSPKTGEVGEARGTGMPAPARVRHDLSLADPRAVGALAVALKEGGGSIQHTASEALLALLPRVRPDHAVHIAPIQMNALLELAFRSHSSMQIAVLQALEQIGDGRAIPVVQNLALSPHRAVREQARQCLPFLTTRARKAEQSATLLRGAVSPGADAGGRELLRPTVSRIEQTTRPDELLRSTNPAS